MLSSRNQWKSDCAFRAKKKKGPQRHSAEIDFIAVEKGYRNIGIGTEMLKTLISYAEKTRMKMLVLTFYSTNKRAKHVYEKLGFREIGRIPNSLYKNGVFVDEIIMVKQLR